MKFIFYKKWKLFVLLDAYVIQILGVFLLQKLGGIKTCLFKVSGPNSVLQVGSASLLFKLLN